MTAANDSTNPPRPPDDPETGPYRIADDAAPTAARPAVAPKPDLSDSEDRDSSGSAADESDATDEDGTDSLAPPISRQANPHPWLVVAGVCAALLALSWLAGAPQLALPDAGGHTAELRFGERLNGLARMIVFIPLATLAAVFGLGALAFVRQRPIGAVAPLFAKALAIVCMAALIWLVPTDMRMLKQALNMVGLPLVATALAVPLFRLHPRDAAFATAYALLGILLLIGTAWVIVWAASSGM